MAGIRKLGIVYRDSNDKRAVDQAKLNDLSDVNYDEGTILNDFVLSWDSTNSYFIAKQVSTGGGVTDHGALTGLGDDDHTQYHNDTRALSWLGTRSTDDLPEGSSNFYYSSTRFNADFATKTTDNLSEGTSNFYFTDERAQDAVGNALVDSTTIDFTYTDSTNQITAIVIQSGIDHGSIGGLSDDDHPQYLLISGTRAMTGSLNMNQNSIINVITLSAYASYIEAKGGNNMEFSIFDTDSGHPRLTFRETNSGLRGTILAYNSGTTPAPGLNEIRFLVGASSVLFMDLHESQDQINMYKDLDMNGQQILNASIAGSIDHGGLTGLSDDDHTQYHNDTRGDARYYTKTLLNGGQLDNRYYTETELNNGQLDSRYYTETEHINVSAGVGDAGKPIVLDSAGHIDASMINDADIDHGSIGGLSDDDHTQYHNDSRALTWHSGLSGAHVTNGDSHDHSGGDGAQIDHGGLGGLGDDDHSQYHNDTRGDARYYTKTLLDAGQLDNRYYTETEVDSKFNITTGHDHDGVDSKKVDHGNLDGLTDDDHTQYHNDTRGDARYYTKTLLDGGQLDNRYYTETEHINVSAGSGDAGKPIVLDANGHVDASMINDADIDHGSIGGLADDDHTQYHNDTRGDARYYTKTLLDGGQLDNRYYTETEIDALFNITTGHDHDGVNSKKVDHGNLNGLSDDDHTQYSLANGTRPFTGSVSIYNAASLILYNSTETESGSIYRDDTYLYIDAGTGGELNFSANGSGLGTWTSSSGLYSAGSISTSGSFYVPSTNKIYFDYGVSTNYSISKTVAGNLLYQSAGEHWFEDDVALRTGSTLDIYNSGDTEYAQISRDDNYLYIDSGTGGEIRFNIAGNERLSLSDTVLYTTTNILVEGPDGWDGTGDLALIRFGGGQNGVGARYGGPGLIFAVWHATLSGYFGANSQDAMYILENDGSIYHNYATYQRSGSVLYINNSGDTEYASFNRSDTTLYINSGTGGDYIDLQIAGTTVLQLSSSLAAFSSYVDILNGNVLSLYNIGDSEHGQIYRNDDYLYIKSGSGGELYFDTDTIGYLAVAQTAVIYWDDTDFSPMTDLTMDCGLSDKRWSTNHTNNYHQYKWHYLWDEATVTDDDSTWTTIETYTVPSDTTVKIEAHITGRDANSTPNSAAFEIVGLFADDGSTPVKQVGTTTTVFSATDASNQARFLISGSYVYIQVLGNASVNMNWSCNLRIQERT